ncbi:MAG: hypothetical protein KC613_26925, partial [Myxococcales bacterium]|nr:hypothetical protein [Myxococcales bacterium]
VDALRPGAQAWQARRLTGADLAAHDFSADEVADVVAILAAQGRVGADGALDAAQAAWFAEVSHLATLRVPGSEDYAAEIFFALHDRARHVLTQVEARVEAVRAVADAQRAAVVGALQAELRLDAPRAALLLDAVFGADGDAVAASLGPALATGDARTDEDAPLAPPPAFARQLGLIRRLAALARHLELTERQLRVALSEQSLLAKCPEPLTLPRVDGAPLARVDAILAAEGADLLLFSGARFWRYDPATLALRGGPDPLANLLPVATPPALDAAFVDGQGGAWLVGDGRTWVRRAGQSQFVTVERKWGATDRPLDRVGRIAGGYVDRDGRFNLFVGGRWLVHETLAGDADLAPGFPRMIGEWWARQGVEGPAPAGLAEQGPRGGVIAPDGALHLFTRQHAVSLADPSSLVAVADRWGATLNPFAGGGRIDGAATVKHPTLGWAHLLFSGDQVLAYGDSVELAGAVALEGYPLPVAKAFPELPEVLHAGLSAGFTGPAGETWLFGAGGCARLGDGALRDAATTWGRVADGLEADGTVDAAFTGADGRTYLFSGPNYVRYSGDGHGHVDEGYPRPIAEDWGGLSAVDAAVVMGGQTHLFGKGGQHVRYSSADYTTPDEGFPKAAMDDLWALPPGMERPTAVVATPDGGLSFFAGTQVVTYDHNQRWWSAPRPAHEAWGGLPEGAKVGAGFTGRDGRIYLFYQAPEQAPRYLRYTDPAHRAADERFPRSSAGVWGRVDNRLAQTGRVDAALFVPADGDEAGRLYLVSGDQYARYTGDLSAGRAMDPGYPRRVDRGL